MSKKRRKIYSYNHTVSYSRISMTLLLIVIMSFGIYCIVNSKTPKEVISNKKDVAIDSNLVTSAVTETTEETESEVVDLHAVITPSTVQFGADVYSQNDILIDESTNEVIAERNSAAKIFPASLTKIMTVITALDMTDNLDDTFTIPEFIFQNLYDQDASMAGFQPNETIKIIDLMYGAVLPSGADATTGLSMYTCGTEAAFVEQMNKKAEELGISETTHFTNASGLHDDNHYTTASDLAIILNYALKNPTFRQIFTAQTYTTSPTNINPSGIELCSTLFSRIYGNEVEGVTILGGKTGYTDQAGSCLASIAQKDGKEYMLITANADQNSGYEYPHINDAFVIYGSYLK